MCFPCRRSWVQFEHLQEVDKLLRAVADGDTEMVRYLLEWVDDDLEEPGVEGNVEKVEFCHPLCQCSRCGPVQKKFFRVHSNGLGVNVTNQEGRTPLHVAALHGHADLVSLLLKHGASIGAKDATHAVPLHLACQNGHLQVVKCLLECSAKQNTKDIHGNTPLMYACLNGYQEIAAFLLQHGALVNLSNNQGNTSLHRAVIGSYESLVQLLLQHGASTHVRNNRHCTPLDYAESNSGIFELLQAAATSGEGGWTDYKAHRDGKIRGKSVTFEVSFKSSAIADNLIARRLQLVQSINQFNKSKDLRKTITRDKSVPNFDDELLHQLAIKNFDKSKLKPVDSLDRNQTQILEERGAGGSTRKEEGTGVATAPLKSKLMHRSHTVNVALSATEASDTCNVSRSSDPSRRLL